MFLDSREKSVIALQSLWNAMRLTAFESFTSHELKYGLKLQLAAQGPRDGQTLVE